MKKLFSLLLCALLFCSLAACGKQDPPSSAPVPSSSSQVSSASEPDPIVLDQAFLTGEAKDADYPEGKRITAVMVNNAPDARPANGLSEADVLVEIKVEGGITRFMALYSNYETLPTIGSIRSARDQFFQLLIPFWGFYIHEGPGGEHPVNWLIRDYEYQEFDLTRMYYGQLLYEDPARTTKIYNWYNADGERAAAAVAAKGADDYRSYGSPMFNFVPYTDPVRVPEGGAAEEVAVIHSQSFRTLFEYDGGSETYLMSMFNSYNGRVEPTVDNNNQARLAFENLLVLFAPMELYPNQNAGLVKVDYSVGGAGYLFTQGAYELVFWRKGGPNHPLVLERGDGGSEPVYLNVGRTYLAVVDDDELPAFDAHLKEGTGGDAVASGVVDTSIVDPDD